MKHDVTFNCVRLLLSRLFRSSAVAADAICRSVRHGGSLPCTSPYTLNYFESWSKCIQSIWNTACARHTGWFHTLTRSSDHCSCLFRFSCSSHGWQHADPSGSGANWEGFKLAFWRWAQRCRERYFGSNSHLLNTHAIFYIIGGKWLRFSRLGCSVKTLQRRRALHFVGRATCLLFVESVLIWVPVFVPFWKHAKCSWMEAMGV